MPLRQLPAIVRVIGDTRHGHATWMQDGRLIAAAHCLEPSSFGLVVLAAGPERFLAEVESIDRGTDVAFLRRPIGYGQREKILYRRIRESSKCITVSRRPLDSDCGQQFRVFTPHSGWQLGSGNLRNHRGNPALQVSVITAVPRGSSGCPIIDRFDELVTVITHGDERPESAAEHFVLGPLRVG